MNREPGGTRATPHPGPLLDRGGEGEACTVKQGKKALHENLGFWSSAFTRSGPPEGGTPNWLPTIVTFMVPMHAQTRMEASRERLCAHEIQPADAGLPEPFASGILVTTLG